MAQEALATQATPRISPDAVRIAAVAVGALVMVAAMATGWREGGIWIAVVGLGLGGLASLSLPYPARR